MNASEQPVPLQSDTVTTAPGGVRAINAVVLVNGVPTLVQMQVVSLADANGRVLQDLSALTDPMEAVVDELRQIKRLLAIIAQVPETFAGDTERVKTTQ